MASEGPVLPDQNKLAEEVQQLSLDQIDQNHDGPGQSAEERECDTQQQAKATTPLARPQTLRRVTDPIPCTSSSNVHLRPAAPVQSSSRNRSPYSRSHLRTRSSNASLGYPMARAYSSPLADTMNSLPERHPLPEQTQTQPRSASPMGAPYTRRASPRRQLDEPFAYTQTEIVPRSVPTIEEHAELSLPLPSPSFTIPEDGVAPSSSPVPSHSTFPRSRRRPSSPLHSFAQPPRIGSPGGRMLHTSSSVPVLSTVHGNSAGDSINRHIVSSSCSKYNESFPTSHPPTSATAALSSASSIYSLSMSASAYSNSMPSTPTSLRSRSPSISSLETIPDSPDAEAEAIEDERLDRMDRLDRLEKLRNVIGTRESEELGRRMLGGGRERKRWSVCGAERRGDLEMETLWEED